MSSAVNPFKNIGRNTLYLVGGLIVSVFVTKKLVNSNKQIQFDRMQAEEITKENYYKNLANIKPGFPLPAEDSSDVRKSEFEGRGLSYLSRKGGDRLGFLDRRSGSD
ncbi:LAME_0F10440g1_1 [Lachancea meyersii CBS 8951]|uniref:LAME_0F10440g1_1 n=1 Tax=Lachancea meyersii CBS 8951 TaxID=1266667 RepID=A0A1G4JVP4_9SACH|nr:LAME_0F10440g1_1 [Lachancea meyersii CBS 8951]